ncbi:uncharacterized protein LOC102717739 isoform X2 [Oryza brachyantha]|uniref:uncharacterized protein LOC102717739 isoform X2 n=1 Tax=Oryza brachyantha TaxID=4533 RepID=UPI0007761F00|nr:uncharacterized protein LOC102717739 isoform X2 [Oryza brachyantha]
MFDNDEEYVGVDDEHIYVPQNSENVQASEYTDHTPTEPGQSSQSDAVGDGAPEAQVTDEDPQVLNVIHDPENPNIVKDALFPDIVAFRKAIRHYAIKNGFSFAPGLKTDPTRFLAKCAVDGCPWRIHASKLPGCKVIKIKVLHAKHNCPSTKLHENKMATQGWCADRLADWVKQNPRKKAKDAKEKLEQDYDIKLKYSKAWSGLKSALEQIHGKYEESF